MQFQSVSLNYQLNHFKNFQGTCISLQDLQDICMYCQQSQTWWRVAHLHGLKIKGHCKWYTQLIISSIPVTHSASHVRSHQVTSCTSSWEENLVFRVFGLSTSKYRYRFYQTWMYHMPLNWQLNFVEVKVTHA